MYCHALPGFFLIVTSFSFIHLFLFVRMLATEPRALCIETNTLSLNYTCRANVCLFMTEKPEPGAWDSCPG